MLSQQLILRNQDLSGLYEKLKLQNSLLRKGETFYHEKSLRLREVQQENEGLQQQQALYMKDVQNDEDLKAKISALQTALSDEKRRVRALMGKLKHYEKEEKGR